MAQAYMPLRVNGVADKAGATACHEARMVVKNHRVAVEKMRVELKADALAYGRAVDGEAKRLTGLLEPIENHLQAQEDIVFKEQERQQRAAAEAHRLAEEARVRAEQEAMAKERAELERLRQEQAAESARIAAAQKKLDDAENAKRRAEEMDRARAEAAERARLETEQRLAREAAAAEARKKAEAEESAREEAERPYRDRVFAFSATVAALAVPEGPQTEAIRAILLKAGADIRMLFPVRRLRRA
jgi:hypothetical protein